jgi:hypothetical protein
MKNKKKTKETLLSYGLAQMDKSFEKAYGLKVVTEWDIIEERYVTRCESELSSEHNAFLSGYSKALVDMFIAARL